MKGGYADGPGRTARFNVPGSFYMSALDDSIYVADTQNYRIRKVEFVKK